MFFGNNSCIWIIVIIIVLFCCCGDGFGGGCDCDRRCRRDGCCD